MRWTLSATVTAQLHQKTQNQHKVHQHLTIQISHLNKHWSYRWLSNRIDWWTKAFFSLFFLNRGTLTTPVKGQKSIFSIKSMDRVRGDDVWKSEKVFSMICLKRALSRLIISEQVWISFYNIVYNDIWWYIKMWYCLSLYNKTWYFLRRYIMMFYGLRLYCNGTIVFCIAIYYDIDTLRPLWIQRLHYTEYIYIYRID